MTNKKLTYFIKEYLGNLITGFLLAFVLLNLTDCPSDISKPEDVPKYSEPAKLKTYVETLSNVLPALTQQETLENIYEENRIVQEPYLEITQEKNSKLAEALKSRKLIFSNELYAEYELNIDGSYFTIAFGQSGDGIWKIIRF